MSLRKKEINVVYADDDLDDCELFQEAINQLNLNITLTIVNNGVEALRCIPSLSPDIIFLDINMPLKCGRMCLREIRADLAFQKTPVIIFSTSRDKKDIDETFKDGANLYAIKPDFFEDHVSIMKLIFSLYQNETLFLNDRKEFLLSDHKKYDRNLKLDFNRDFISF